MNGPRPGLQPDSTVGTRRRAADDRDHAADARDKAAHARDRAAAERERAADARDRIADDRDRVADRRDQVAEERDRIAGDRDVALDSRQAAIEDRQDELTAWDREGAALTRVVENSRIVDDGRDRLARSRHLVDRLAPRRERARETERTEPPAA